MRSKILRLASAPVCTALVYPGMVCIALVCIGMVCTAFPGATLWAQSSAPASPAPTASAPGGSASTQPAYPTDAKARRTYAGAEDAVRQHMPQFAAEGFHKADKQDGGHCRDCEERALKAAVQSGDSKLQYECADALIAMADSPLHKSEAHTRKGFLLSNEGIAKKKDQLQLAALEEFKTALELWPEPYAEYGEGIALAHLNRDQEARPHFEAFLKVTAGGDADHLRAQRFLDRPELVRARMTPAFAVTTLDGQRVSLDQMAGKVVLIDFWATWCGPCKEALPRVRELAKKFESRPFVVLSVSLDKNENEWKDFVAKHDMTWPQYRDSGFDGRLSTLFGIHAIPATFTVDADGVLQDQHVGEADIEGKIKKLIARAEQAQNLEKRPPVPISELSARPN